MGGRAALAIAAGVCGAVLVGGGSLWALTVSRSGVLPAIDGGPVSSAVAASESSAAAAGWQFASSAVPAVLAASGEQPSPSSVTPPTAGQAQGQAEASSGASAASPHPSSASASLPQAASVPAVATQPAAQTVPMDSAASGGGSAATTPTPATSGSAPALGVLVPPCGAAQLCPVPGYPGVYSTPGDVYDPALGRAAVIPPRTVGQRLYLCAEEGTC